MNALPDGTELGAVRLTIRDLPRVRTFYESVLGLHGVQDEGGRHVMLSCPDGRHLVELRANRFAAPPDPEGPGLYHLALRVPTRRDLSVVLLRLAARGVKLTGASDHLVSEALYLRDPEGNGIEVYRDGRRGLAPRRRWPAPDGHAPA